MQYLPTSPVVSAKYRGFVSTLSLIVVSRHDRGVPPGGWRHNTLRMMLAFFTHYIPRLWQTIYIAPSARGLH